MMNEEEIRALPDAELEALDDAVGAELSRRRVLAQAPEQAASLNRQVLQAQGQTPGQPWRPPEGAHDSYPLDWQVLHEGDMWVSLVEANVWEPGTSAWRKVAPEGQVPEWLQPTGQHDAYHAGDEVMYEGSVYRSTIDNNVWAPTAYPAGWELVQGAS